NRSLFKASSQYRNDSWDLVDAVNSGQAKLGEVKKEELPVEMQKMTEPERKAYVESKAKEREEIQANIARLNAARTKYLAEKASQPGPANTLDAVVTAAIREQAVKKNYRFE